MAEKNKVKPRKCEHCARTLELTAKGIKEHADTCPTRPKKWSVKK